MEAICTKFFDCELTLPMQHYFAKMLSSLGLALCQCCINKANSEPYRSKNKRKKERIGHTLHVVHYVEAYMNREKAEELNKSSTIEAWE